MIVISMAYGLPRRHFVNKYYILRVSLPSAPAGFLPLSNLCIHLPQLEIKRNQGNQNGELLIKPPSTAEALESVRSDCAVTFELCRSQHHKM